MEGKKSISINLIASILVFIINIGISFFLTPYISERIGTEAYGFISLANNFVNYATIITLALNSLSGRFVSMAIHKKEEKEASVYLSSIFWANIIVISFLLIPSFFIVMYLDKFLNIPNNIIFDVKILFTLVFTNFFVGIISSTYQIATFATNQLHLQSIRSLECNFIKVSILLIICIFFTPHVFYVGFASLITSIFGLLYNIYYKKKLLPNIIIKKCLVSLKKIKEVTFSGIWYTITKIGQILSDGLDLIICNLFIDPYSMGQLAIAKTLSSTLGTLMGTVSGIFQPEFIINYAHGKIDKLIQEIKLAMKVSGIFTNIPLAFLVVFGKNFYELWLPTQDSQLLYILTILSIQDAIFSGAINPMYSIYNVVNKVRVDALCRVVMGFLSTLIVFIIVKKTSFGIYAIAGTSRLIEAIFDIIFVPLYVSKTCLNINWKTFYPIIFKYSFTTIILIVCFACIKAFINIETWSIFFVMVFLCGICGLIINYIVLLNNNERKEIIDTAKSFFVK